MPAWTAFASVAGAVTALLLLLAHATSQGLDAAATEPLEPDPGFDRRGTVDDPAAPRPESRESGDDRTRTPERSDEGSDDRSDDRSDSIGSASTDARSSGLESRDAGSDPSLSAGMVFANVALTHGVFGVVLVVAAVAAAIPPGALGVAAVDRSVAWAGVGLALGVVLYGVGEIGAGVASDAGFEHSETLRALLAPETPVGWLVLLGGVLPVVAGFEELLFRAVLVGAFAAGFDVPVALLVLASSVAFGLGHGAQGHLGIAVTTGFGVVLAVAFLASGSLLVVVVAHYVVNALEFVVHEGLDVDWATHAD